MLAEFCEQLRELRRHAGKPALRELRDRMDSRPGISTLSELLSGNIRRVPRWELVSEFVGACDKYAREMKRPLDTAEADLAMWRRRHEEVHRAIDAAAPEHRAALIPLLRTGFVPTRLDKLPDDELDAMAPRRKAHRYIPRPDFDDEFVAALADATASPYPFVIVYGDHGSGKTCSAIAGVRAAMPPETSVLIPKDGTALAAIAELERLSEQDSGPMLVWLDDVTAADLNALSVRILDRLATVATIVGTMSADRLAQILDTAPEGGSRARVVLRRAYHIYLPAELSEDELAVAISMYPGKRFTSGLGHAFAGVEDLRLRLNTARHINPAGAAIVRAAVDCWRAGVRAPLTRADLRRLFPAYMRLYSATAPSDEAFDKGLAWALEHAAGIPALLLAVDGGEPRWHVSAALAESERAPILGQLWPALIEMSEPDECVDIGFAASRLGEGVYACAAFAKAAGAEAVPGERALLHAAALHELGSLKEARQVLRSVVDGGAPTDVGTAAHILGMMLARAGEIDQAVEVLEIGASLDDPDSSPLSLYELGMLHCRAGRINEAIEPLERAAASGHPQAATNAQAVLAAIKADSGEFDLAIDMFRQVSDLASPALADAARESIGELLNRKAQLEQISQAETSKLAQANELVALGDTESGVRAYLEALADDPDLTAEVQSAVGAVRRAQGHLDEARLAYEASMAQGTSKESGLAALSLGALHMEFTDDHQAARRAFEHALACEGSLVQAKAAINLGLLAGIAKDTTAAIGYFELAQGFGVPQLRAKAALNIANILEDLGAGFDEWAAQYRIAVEADDPEFSPQAAVALAGHLIDRGEDEEALRLIDYSTASEHVEAQAKAMWLLGAYRERQGDIEGAIEMFESVIAGGHEEFSIAAHGSLGRMLAENDHLEEGERHLLVAFESENPKWAPDAGITLGLLYEFSDRHRSAERVLAKVTNSADDPSAAAAGLVLGEIYLRQGLVGQAVQAWRAAVARGHEPVTRRAAEMIERYSDT